jgi:hypothetical protein
MEVSDTAYDMLRGARSHCFRELLKLERKGGRVSRAGEQGEEGYREAFRLLNRLYVVLKRSLR